MLRGGYTHRPYTVTIDHMLVQDLDCLSTILFLLPVVYTQLTAIQSIYSQ